MKNRTSVLIVSGLIVLSIIGLGSRLWHDPAEVLKYFAFIAVIGAVIYYLVRRFSGSGPANHQQRAFQKAAKRSKKRFQAKEANTSSKRSKIRSIASARKTKDASHLTVIDGKKSKKKNRASF